MSIEGIMFYTFRATVFALLLVIIYFLAQKIRGKKPDRYSVFVIFYISMLINITVIRGGISFVGTRGPWQLTPFVHTIYQLRGGLWTFLYPFLGNVLWFVPMGIILGRKFSFMKTIVLSFLISLSIEFLQWIFISGISDIDDIIFNVMGAGTGYLVYFLFYKRKK